MPQPKRSLWAKQMWEVINWIHKSYVSAASVGSLMRCNVYLMRADWFYLIQTPNSFILFQSSLCPLILFNSLSESLFINRDKPEHICLKPLPGWWSHRNDTYFLPFQMTLMAYWRARNRLLFLCVYAERGVYSHISPDFFNLFSEHLLSFQIPQKESLLVLVPLT